jgi:hypothetical protein
MKLQTDNAFLVKEGLIRAAFACCHRLCVRGKPERIPMPVEWRKSPGKSFEYIGLWGFRRQLHRVPADLLVSVFGDLAANRFRDQLRAKTYT